MIRIAMMIPSLTPWPLGRMIELDQVSLALFAPSGIDWRGQTMLGLHLEEGRWVQRRTTFPQAVYNRCYSEQRSLIQRLERVIGEKRVFNYVTRFDKWEIDRVLRRGGLGGYLPETFPFKEGIWAQMVDGKNGVLIKPRRGQGGKGIYRLRRRAHGEIEVSEGFGLRPVAALPDDRDRWSVSHIIQKEISMLKWKDSVFDMRILMQKDKNGQWQVSGDLSRVAVPGVFVTNLCKKICFAEDVLVQVGLDPAEILPRLESISSKVAELLEEHFVMLGEIGVDFALDTEGRVWVIEVNGKPDRNLFFALRDEELIKRILARPLEYACYLADQ
jgi:hypothetical protein